MPASTLTLIDDGYREYVRCQDLEDEIRSWMKATGRTYHDLARRAGLAPRTIRKILKHEKELHTIDVADKLMVHMGSHIGFLETVWKKPGRSKIAS